LRKKKINEGKAEKEGGNIKGRNEKRWER